MNPIVAIPILALIITAIIVTSVMSVQLQNDAIDTSIDISESQNRRIREDILFTLDSDNNFIIENMWSDNTKVMEIRVIDEDGKMTKSWAIDQDVNPGASKQLSRNDELKAYLQSTP